MVLVGSAVHGLSGRPEHAHLYAQSAAARKAGDLDALREALMYLTLDGPARPRGYVAEPLRSLFLDMNKHQLSSDFEKAPPRWSDPPAAKRLGDITASTLVVVGDEDSPNVLWAADLLMDSIPHASKAVIHDAAHLPNLEHPKEFNRIVLDFLAAD